MDTVVEKLQKLYKEVVENTVGAVARIDDFGNVEFKIIRYGTFDIFIYGNDPEYFRIRAGVSIPEDKGLSEYDLLSIANEVNQNKKSVKVTLNEYADDSMKYFQLTTESFIAKPDEMPEKILVESVIERCISSIQFTGDELKSRLDARIKEIEEKKNQKTANPST